jgi:hypothetical protein
MLLKFSRLFRRLHEMTESAPEHEFTCSLKNFSKVFQRPAEKQQ